MKPISKSKSGHVPQSTVKLLLPLILGSTLAANGAPPPGQLLSSMCFQCHGTNGQPVSGFEDIGGENANEMYNELLEMSLRKPEGIMDLQVRAFTPAQLRLIANYLSTRPKGGGAGEHEPERD